MNQRLTQENHNLLGLSNWQMNRTFETAINERVIPKVQNVVDNLIFGDRNNWTQPSGYQLNRAVNSRSLKCSVSWTWTQRDLFQNQKERNSVLKLGNFNRRIHVEFSSQSELRMSKRKAKKNYYMILSAEAFGQL